MNGEAHSTRPLDMSKIFNRGFRDVKGEGLAGGWTGQGDNDLRGMKPGVFTVGAVDFKIVDPAANGNKATLAMRRADPLFVERAELKVERVFDWLYLLDAGAWLSFGTLAGSVELLYADGSKEELPVKAGINVADWWSCQNVDSAVQAPLRMANPLRNEVALYASWLRNPKPELEVASIVFNAASESWSNATWMLLAASTSSGENLLAPKRESPLRLAGSLPEPWRLVMKKDFKNAPDNSHPDGIRIENWCDHPHKMGYAHGGSYALVYSGNKHLLMTDELKDFALSFDCRSDKLFSSAPGVFAFFRYDEKAKRGGCVSINLGDGKASALVGRAEKTEYVFGETKEFDLVSGFLLLELRDGELSVSAGGEKAVFEIPSGLPEKGSVGFDRSFFMGPLLISDVELWSPDKLEKGEALWPKRSFEFPKSLSGFDSHWIFSFEAERRARGVELRGSLSGGPGERERNAAMSGIMPNEELVDPWFRIVSPSGELGERNFILLGRAGLKESWNKEQPALPPADAECPITREFRFASLPEGSKLLVGFERSWEEDRLHLPGGPLEILLDPWSGEKLFAGRSIPFSDVVAKVSSGSGKRICGMIPADAARREEALAFAAGNHYFIEGERCRFEVSLRFREKEISACELSAEARLDDVFGKPLKKPSKLKFGAPSPCPVPGELEVKASVDFGARPLGVYHLSLSLASGGAPLRTERVAFECMGVSPDSPCPPQASGLPELLSIHTDNISPTDHFDPWGPDGVDVSHYYSISSFQPLFAEKTRPWELLRLYRRKWLLWLASRTTPRFDPLQNKTLVENAGFCTSDSSRLKACDPASYTEEVREKLKEFLVLNGIEDGPLSASSFDPAKPFSLELCEKLLESQGCAWLEFIARFHETRIKKGGELVKSINPKVKLMNYGAYAVYTAAVNGAFHTLEEGRDYRLSPEKTFDGFFLFEDYPWLCGYPLQRSCYMLAAIKMENPAMKIYPEIYSIAGVPRDVATTYGRPPCGISMTEVFPKRFYEYACGTAWMRDGEFSFWSDNGFHLRDARRSELDSFIETWGKIREAKPLKPARSVAFVTSVACCLKHKETVRRVRHFNSECLSVFNTVEEFPAFVNEIMRCDGQQNGFLVRPVDLAKLSVEDVHTLVLPPLSTLEESELEAVRKLHKAGVSLLCEEDVSGMEEVFGVAEREPLAFSKIEGAAGVETADDPLCFSKYDALPGTELVLRGVSASGETAPALCVRKSGRAFAALYTIPPSVVRKFRVAAKHADQGRASVSELIRSSVAEIMRRIGAPEVSTSEGKLLAFIDGEGALRVVVSEDAHPAPAKAITPVVLVKTHGRKAKLSCDKGLTLLSETKNEIAFRLRLGPDEAALVKLSWLKS